MLIGIGLFVAGVVVGTIFGKTIVADSYAIKAHITAEISALEGRIKARL